MKTKILLGLLVVVMLLLVSCIEIEMEVKEEISCSSDEDCTYYYQYDCVYAVGKDDLKAEQKIEKGPPSMTAHCLGEEYFDYNCVEGTCKKMERCELICDLEEEMAEIVEVEDCPATSQACNLYQKCGCEETVKIE